MSKANLVSRDNLSVVSGEFFRITATGIQTTFKIMVGCKLYINFSLRKISYFTFYAKADNPIQRY
jgi:hypothetical protein